MLVFNHEDELILESHIGVNLPHESHPYPCIDPDNLHAGHGHGHGGGGSSEGDAGEMEHTCLEWKNNARLNITHRFLEGGANCYSLAWQSLSPDVSPMDCYPVGDELKGQGHWYGGGESLSATWPLDRGHIALSAFITGDEVSG